MRPSRNDAALARCRHTNSVTTAGTAPDASSAVRALSRFPQVSMRPVEINGGPGAIYVDDHDRVLGVWSLEISDGEIRGIRSIVNPEKLAHLGEVGDVVAIIQAAR